MTGKVIIKPLDDLCCLITKQTGFDYSTTIKPSLATKQLDGFLPFIQNKDFEGEHINLKTDYYVPEKIALRFPKILLDSTILLISISGKIGNVGLYNIPQLSFVGGAICVCRLKKEENGKYLMYYLQSSKGQNHLLHSVKAASHSNITVEDIRKVPIPIPSLSEQTRIVEILDTFTASIENLKQQIADRRKQYEHYRDQLLDLEGKEGVEMKTIGMIAKYRRGSFPQPYGNKEWYDGEGAMPFVQVADVEESGMKLKSSTKQFISRLAMPKSVYAPIGTILVTLQGSIGKVAITQYNSYVDRTLGIFEGFTIDINKKYFAHQLEKIFAIKKEKARGGTIKTITKEEFTNFPIPIPSHDEQQRIVSILDTFEASIQNLEAQLKEREKQYEYYRNKLLTFD